MSEGSSPSNRIATLSPLPAATCLSTQLYAALSFPLRNQATSPFASDPLWMEVKGANQSSVANACSRQKASLSCKERAYISSY